jgi:oligopeptide transport system ATP-binding protein
MPTALLSVRGLKKRFPIRRGLFPRVVGHVQAVESIDLDVAPGEALGLVGESGCGKTTAGRCLLRLIEPTAGEIHFDGKPIHGLDRAGLRPYRREMQIVFQDPFSSLNPRHTIFETLAEPLRLHGLARTEDECRTQSRTLMERVGLNPDYLNRYPHEFSGGQRQRIGIARALAPRPRFIVCDEPVSALDVSVQAQILNLLKDLKQDLGLSYLFVAHDLGVVRHLCDRVAVMYLGRIVEVGTAEDLFTNPQHPYTRALLSAVPSPDPRRHRERILLKGDVPTPINPPSGCHFHTRCPYAVPACAATVPLLRQVADSHNVACERLEEIQGTR